MKNIAANEKGLTLVEIIAVLVILGLIGTVIINKVLTNSETARAKLNEAKVTTLRSALQNYRLEYGLFPSKIEDLVTGGAETKNTGRAFIPMVSQEDLKDIWQTPFQYTVQANGRSYSLVTLGADGVPGGTGANADVTVTP